MRRNLLSLALSAFVCAACTATAPSSTTEIPPAIETITTSAGNAATAATTTPTTAEGQSFTADWDGRAIAATWTVSLHQSLSGPQGAPLLAANPTDVATFCPHFANLSAHDREQFWITFISAMARKESNFNPTSRYDEPGLAQDSIGLMQLSLGDRTSYGCAFSTEDDIKDPANNLDCSVRIFSRLISSAGHIGGGDDHTGAARYFGTLWTNTPGHREARAYIISKASASLGCTS